MSFLHERKDIKDLYEALSNAFKPKIAGVLIEKDYWLMHCLWALKDQGLIFELKGGTSLTKGFELINRFSEDIDIHIHPPEGMVVRTGKNDQKPAHIASREHYFDWLAQEIKIPGIVRVERDREFDDDQKRNAGIRLIYDSQYEFLPGLKQGILLEVGFDDITPIEPKTVSSWALDKALQSKLNIKDNRAMDIPCYLPEFTFVEKLQTISTKFRQQQETAKIPKNFIRHYYDVYQLLGSDRVLSFIGTPNYVAHKARRFRAKDEKNLTKNEAFILSDSKTRKLYASEYDRIEAVFFKGRPTFDEILKRIAEHIEKL